MVGQHGVWGNEHPLQEISQHHFTKEKLLTCLCNVLCCRSWIFSRLGGLFVEKIGTNYPANNRPGLGISFGKVGNEGSDRLHFRCFVQDAYERTGSTILSVQGQLSKIKRQFLVQKARKRLLNRRCMPVQNVDGDTMGTLLSFTATYTLLSFTATATVAPG